MKRYSREKIIIIIALNTVTFLMLNAFPDHCRPIEKAVSRKKTEQRGWSARQVEQIEKTIVHYTNRERAKKGLKSLEPSSALKYIAQKHTEHMCDAKLLAHESDAFPQDWRTLVQRLRIGNVRAGAENVAYRTIEEKTDEWAAQIMKGWMKSAPHRKNILDKSQKYIGVRVVPCKDEIGYTTQVFSPTPGSIP